MIEFSLMDVGYAMKLPYTNHIAPITRIVSDES